MFWSRKIKSPISKEDEDYIESSFEWILESFTDRILLNEIIFPNEFEPFKNKNDVYNIFILLCERMSIDSSKIKILFYNERKQIELDGSLITEFSEETELTTGKYIQNDKKEVEIWIVESKLRNLQSLLATLAHELSHFKLLYEKRLLENDEYLTDILTVFYGLGIYGANSSIAKMNTWSTSSGSGWQVSGAEGYLHFKVWAYTLAKYAILRNDLECKWKELLVPDVKREFEKSIKYLTKDEN